MNNAWKDYNSKLLKNSMELLEKNSRQIFNVEEVRCYPHIRDIIALVISTSKKNILKIYDYGSNTMPWSNIQNKIDIINISVKIYDPYAEQDYASGLDFGFPLSVVNRACFQDISEHDLIIFGSSSQYIKNFFKSIFYNNNYQLPKKILFTDTPFSLVENLKEELLITQIDKENRKFIVYIRNFHSLNTILEKLGYKVVFKSALPWMTQDYLPKKLSSEIKMVNLLYEK